MPDLIWNYEDVHNNLLSVYQGKQCMGYFRIDRDDFVIITDQPEPINWDDGHTCILSKQEKEKDDE